MAGGADTFLKVTVGVSFLFGAFAIGHYFLIYLPDRDAALDAQRNRAIVEQQIREDQARRASEAKQAAEKASAEIRSQSIQARYEACLRNAMTNYSASWDQSCKVISDKSKRDRASCNSSKEWCDSMYPTIPATDCSLPQVVAANKNDSLEKARNRCLQESQAGFQ